MSRIVLATLGSLGDLHPLLGLAVSLKDRGHAVVVASSEFYRARIESAGFEFAPMRPLASPDDARLVRQVMDPGGGPEFLLRTVLLPHLRDTYDDLLAACRSADFLVAGEIVLAAPLVAEKTGLPWSGAILAPASFFSVHDPSIIPSLPWGERLATAPACVQRLLLRIARVATGSWSRPILALRRELGLRLAVQPLFRDRFSPLLNLALFSDVLGRPQPDWPRNTVQSGFVYYDTPHQNEPDPQLDEFMRKGPPPIVFTLGSTAVLLAGDFFEQSLEAARLLGRRALLIMGKNPGLGARSEDCFTCEYAAYSKVFAAAACVVHQGGVGTTAQALRAGVPQLVIPHAFDQPDNAARIVRLGVGLQLRRNHYRGARIAALLEKLLATEGYRLRAQDTSRRLATEQGAETACAAISAAIQTRPVSFQG